ncbi:hypothetical protein ABZ816_31265 [Actinosynnema sp. NPDC047251]|uniref:Flavin reductase like domain-containing protein n=1 Tax=Saccharothrix espanaensis (strain ATCC 51144 / DSM 44229 / JCM 9112 / NBRC 15066 / NRRL 15764) TaxID=1179773 RepID=K0JY31_SACES|nr:hypothetical protein [Saccharothrix espanaensis]CCH32870.1 hypothetical protein BN6_56110 [Saccharothrix espanaensis DSM 44229]
MRIFSDNENGTPNLAPMSSAFCLGSRALLGLEASSQTTRNMSRTRQCVLNLPSVDLAGAVDRLALTIGVDPVPERKPLCGYRHVEAKFHRAGLTLVASETVSQPRVAECHRRRGGDRRGGAPNGSRR